MSTAACMTTTELEAVGPVSIVTASGASRREGGKEPFLAQWKGCCVPS